MIYTLTLNPAIDYTMNFNKIITGKVCRSSGENITIGGKGINVSLILKELGIDSVATGFLAGFTGAYIEQQLKLKKIESHFFHLDNGFTRINVKIKSDNETDLNADGPIINKDKINDLKLFLKKLTCNDILVISGSVPKTLPDGIYTEILNEIDENVRIVADTNGQLLLNILKFKPFLIKPNNFELGEIFGVKIASPEDTEHYARLLQQKGAKNVLVSLAENGAILIDEYGIRHDISAAKGKVKNSVGAGDSMVAGLLAGFLQNKDYDFALKLGAAAGSATAFSDGLASRSEIINLLNL